MTTQMREIQSSILTGRRILFVGLGGIGNDALLKLRVLLILHYGRIPEWAKFIGIDFPDDPPALKDDLLDCELPSDVRQLAELQSSEMCLLDKSVVPDNIAARVKEGDDQVAWLSQLIDPLLLEHVRGKEASRIPALARALFALWVLHVTPYDTTENLYDLFTRKIGDLATNVPLSDGTVADGGARRRVEIIFVGGTGGGTSPGLLIPAAILAHDVARREGWSISCRAFLLAGDYRPKDGQHLDRASISAGTLFDTQKTVVPDVRFELPVRSDKTLTASGPLFDGVIYDEFDGRLAGNTRAAVSLTAQTLFFTYFDAAGAAATKNATNAEDRPRALALVKGDSSAHTADAYLSHFLGGCRATTLAPAVDLRRTAALAVALESLGVEAASVAPAPPLPRSEFAEGAKRALNRLKAVTSETIEDAFKKSSPAHPKFEERIEKTLRGKLDEIMSGLKSDADAAALVGALDRLTLGELVQAAPATRQSIEAQIDGADKRIAAQRKRLESAENVFAATARPAAPRATATAPASLLPAGTESRNKLILKVVRASAIVFFVVLLGTILGNETIGTGLFLGFVAALATAIIAWVVLRMREAVGRSPKKNAEKLPSVRLGPDAEKFKRALSEVWEARGELAVAEREAAFAHTLITSFDGATAGTAASPHSLLALEGARAILARAWESLPEGPLYELHPGVVILGGRKGSMLVARDALQTRSPEKFEGDLRTLLERGAPSSAELAERIVSSVADSVDLPRMDQLLVRALDADPALADTLSRHLAALRTVATEGLRLRYVPDMCWHGVRLYVPDKVFSVLQPIIEGRIKRSAVTVSPGLTSITFLAESRNVPLRALEGYERMSEAVNRMGDDERRRTVEYPASLCRRNLRLTPKTGTNGAN